jgi:hypothetical protein
MLADLGCRYAIVGHSERRRYHGESDTLVAEKAKRLLEEGITPILCVGEPLEVRERGEAVPYTLAQLLGSLKGVEPQSPDRLVIAYEPVWAIGTGKNATPEDAEAMHQAIRQTLAERYGEAFASRVRVLYGGSVNPKNFADLLSMPNVGRGARGRGQPGAGKLPRPPSDGGLSGYGSEAKKPRPRGPLPTGIKLRYPIPMRLHPRTQAAKESIFPKMSALAQRLGAVNLGPGLPFHPPASLPPGGGAARPWGRYDQYAPPAGLPALREALAEEFGVEPEAVVVTSGATEALYVLLQSLVGPGRRWWSWNPSLTCTCRTLSWPGPRPGWCGFPWGKGASGWTLGPWRGPSPQGPASSS